MKKTFLIIVICLLVCGCTNINKSSLDKILTDSLNSELNVDSSSIKNIYDNNFKNNDYYYNINEIEKKDNEKLNKYYENFYY